ncbi:unnamed protein product [Malus baccata var. baccata]
MWLAVPDRRLSAASPSSSSSAVSTPQLGFDSAQHQQHQQQQHQVGSRQDKSWRVWDMVVNQLYELCDAVGPEATRSDLVPAHVRLQRDNEAEVRIAATGKNGSMRSKRNCYHQYVVELYSILI